uniref:Uncharacterized protein n=1 Tax=Siphoviridae sp. ctKy93 TaxID=2827569 RepID=A0A8S5RS20_9CAUD|nr:MAG TPA: hypothetical protein [Siphoviridae sp. ctKy93]
MRFSDIQISDKELWLQAKDLWRQSKYSQVFSLFQNEQLNKKILNAKSLNDLTDYIVQLENTKDDSFKADKIKVSKTYPTVLENDKVFFKWAGPYTFSEVDNLNYIFNYIDTLNVTRAKVDEGEW